MNAEGPLAALQTDEWITKDTTTRPVTHLDDQVWISRSVPRSVAEKSTNSDVTYFPRYTRPFFRF